MDKVFFNQLKLSQPKYKLNVGSGTHAEETGKMMISIEKVLLKERPTIVLVQGDTNTTLAGALAAVKMLVKVGHVEAGLRSFDRSMPEEINRVLVDHVSDYLFTPTENSRNNLRKEGISDEKIFVTGNTIVDAVCRNIKLAESSNILKKLSLKENEYILVTIHRQENVDNPLKLKNIIKGLKLVRKFTDLPIIYPIHPRSRKRIKELTGKDVAVISSDTSGRPLRIGQVNIAIGVSGLNPILDRRGEKDLFGYTLKVKQIAIADELAAAAELVMGEADEGVPVAIIRGYKKYVKSDNAKASMLVRPIKDDLFV